MVNAKLRNCGRAILVMLCFFCSFVSAQINNTCPAVVLNGPSGFVSFGEIARYQVQFDSGGRNLALAFDWSVSDGSIKNGQGTDRIEVVQPLNCLTATVKIAGLPNGCPTVYSEWTCGDLGPKSEKLVEAAGTLTKSKIDLIDKAVNRYRANSYIQMYVVVSASRKSTIKQRVQALKKLFDTDPSRATFVISELKEDSVVVWAVPPGASPPAASGQKKQ